MKFGDFFTTYFHCIWSKINFSFKNYELTKHNFIKVVKNKDVDLIKRYSFFVVKSMNT
jgi:hypothetical protein